MTCRFGGEDISNVTTGWHVLGRSHDEVQSSTRPFDNTRSPMPTALHLEPFAKYLKFCNMREKVETLKAYLYLSSEYQATNWLR